MFERDGVFVGVGVGVEGSSTSSASMIPGISAGGGVLGDGAEDGDDVKAGDDLRFRPSLLPEVVVERRHQQETLALAPGATGVFEPTDLQHHAHGLGDEDAPGTEP